MLKERWLVIGDIHGPFHDPKLVDLVLTVATDCTHIFLNGDIFDFYWFSRYDKSMIETTLEEEFNWGLEFFESLRKNFPDKKIIFNYGNHEARLDNWIMANAKAFTGWLTIENHLRLNDLGIEYYHYNNAYHVAGTDITIQHSPPSYSQNAARTSLIKKLSGAFIWGCTHRPDSAYLTSYDGRRHEAHCLGWLGSTNLTKDHEKVFSYTKGHDTWGNSFATIDIIGNEYFINHHLIKNYKTVVNGFLYKN